MCGDDLVETSRQLFELRVWAFYTPFKLTIKVSVHRQEVNSHGHRMSICPETECKNSLVGFAKHVISGYRVK